MPLSCVHLFKVRLQRGHTGHCILHIVPRPISELHICNCLNVKFARSLSRDINKRGKFNKHNKTHVEMLSRHSYTTIKNKQKNCLQFI